MPVRSIELSNAELPTALEGLFDFAINVDNADRRDVTEFLKELRNFASESAEEIARACAKDALKQSVSEFATEIGSTIAGLAVKHFAVVLLTLFFRETDKAFRNTQKWQFATALNSGTGNALQALKVVCRSDGDLDLRNHLLRTSVTQLNEAYEMSKKEPRVLLYVRLLQGLASEALGAHGFSRIYLSECVPQFHECVLKLKEKGSKLAEEGNDEIGRADYLRKVGDIDVGFVTRDLVVARTDHQDSGSTPYDDDPDMVERNGWRLLNLSDGCITRIRFFESLIELAVRP